jgi:hypothetical protein
MCLEARETKKEKPNGIFFTFEQQQKKEMRRREKSPNFPLA